MGLRMGLAMGLRTGLATGIGADPIRMPQASAAAWATDATSGIAVPASTTEWSAFIAAKGLSIAAPDAIHLLQETSGDFADSTAGGLTLTATGTISYAQAVTGWSRKGFGTTDGVMGSARTTSASLPDPSTTSLTTLMLAQVNMIGGTRSLYESGPTSGSRIALLAANQVRAFDSANNATGANDPRSAVRPYVNKFDVTHSADTVYTNQEKLSPVYAALAATKALTIGGSAATPATTTYVYAVSWFAANAEISDANVKALLQAMGFSIPWS